MAKSGGIRDGNKQKNGGETMSNKKTEGRSEMIEDLIQQARKKLQAKEYKVSVGDLIRLLQYKQELEAEQPKEIRVTWIDPPKES